MADTTLSAEAQAMVDEGMRLADLLKRASTFSASLVARQDLCLHLERMAAMAAPQPVAREPLSDERVKHLAQTCINEMERPEEARTLNAVVACIRAVEREREIAQGEQP